MAQMAPWPEPTHSDAALYIKCNYNYKLKCTTDDDAAGTRTSRSIHSMLLSILFFLIFFFFWLGISLVSDEIRFWPKVRKVSGRMAVPRGVPCNNPLMTTTHRPTHSPTQARRYCSSALILPHCLIVDVVPTIIIAFYCCFLLYRNGVHWRGLRILNLKRVWIIFQHV